MRSWSRRVPSWFLVTVGVGSSPPAIDRPKCFKPLGMFSGFRRGGATSGRPGVQAEGNQEADPLVGGARPAAGCHPKAGER